MLKWSYTRIQCLFSFLPTTGYLNILRFNGVQALPKFQLKFLNLQAPQQRNQFDYWATQDAKEQNNAHRPCQSGNDTRNEFKPVHAMGLVGTRQNHRHDRVAPRYVPPSICHCLMKPARSAAVKVVQPYAHCLFLFAAGREPLVEMAKASGWRVSGGGGAGGAGGTRGRNRFPLRGNHP